MSPPEPDSLTADRKYRVLLSLSQRMRATLNLDEVLGHVLDAVHSAVHYDAAGIFVLNRAAMGARPGDPRQLIAGIVQRGFDERPPDNDVMLMSGHGLVGHVIRTGEAIHVGDVTLDPRYVVGRVQTRSEMAVPILGADEIIGALNLESDLPHAFTDEDLEILHVFADAASASIGRAMLHHELMERRRAEHQMQLAQAVQSRLLPAAPMRMPGYGIEGLCLPTFEIGGDYYDFIPLTDHQVGLVIADVSGKGLAAGLNMTAFRSLLRSQARKRREPSHLANRMNVLVPDATSESAYVTCVYGILDRNEGCLTYTNCGHNPPLLARAGGGIERLETGGFPLGIFSDSRYETGVVMLEPGDVVLFYTDGVVECPGPAGEEFGTERLASTLVASRHLPAPGILEAVVSSMREHCGSAIFSDDFTMMLLSRDAGPASGR